MNVGVVFPERWSGLRPRRFGGAFLFGRTETSKIRASAVQASRDVLSNVLAYPCGNKLRDVRRVESGGVYPVGPPEYRLIRGSYPAVPLHFRPTALLHHFKAMQRVGDVFSHPSSKCNVVWYERGIVPSLHEAKTLRVF